MSDVAKTLQLPVIVVVEIKLGCINHALLTVEAIESAGIRIAGWVANHATPHSEAAQENIDYLMQNLSVPCLGVVPYLPHASASAISTYLHLPHLHN